MSAATRDTGRCQHCTRLCWLDPDTARIPTHMLQTRQPTWLIPGQPRRRRCPGSLLPPRPEAGR
jgi:hypothetical protein